MITVQYIVVRRDLIDKLGVGTLVTQVSHASMAPLTNKLRENLNKTIEDLFDNETKQWIIGRFTKIILEVPDKSSLLNITERLFADGIDFVKIEEFTLGGELTCIGLKPYNKGRVAPYFKGLSLLGSKMNKDENKY